MINLINDRTEPAEETQVVHWRAGALLRTWLDSTFASAIFNGVVSSITNADSLDIVTKKALGGIHIVSTAFLRITLSKYFFCSYLLLLYLSLYICYPSCCCNIATSHVFFFCFF